MLRFVFGVLFFILTVAGAFILEGGNPSIFFAPSSLIIVLLPTLFAILAVWKFKELLQAFSDSLSKKEESETRERSIKIWAFAERIFYLTGILGWVIGIVLILSVLQANIGRFSLSFAYSLIAPIYGLILGILCRILRYRIISRKNG